MDTVVAESRVSASVVERVRRDVPLEVLPSVVLDGLFDTTPAVAAATVGAAEAGAAAAETDREQGDRGHNGPGDTGRVSRNGPPHHAIGDLHRRRGSRSITPGSNRQLLPG